MKHVVVLILLCAVACGSDPDPTAGGVLLSAYRVGQGTSGEIVVRETERRSDVSVVEVEVHRFGGALGGALFQMACYADIAQQRGKTHFVTLAQELIRRGTEDSPGNDMRMTIGFCDGASREALAVFGRRSTNLELSAVFSVDQAAMAFPSIEQYRVSDG